MMEQLGITSIRQGANGRDPNAPNAANYDEAKGNPYPELPDALKLDNGKPVMNAKQWWKQRRPQIVEHFDREVYGRLPKQRARRELGGGGDERRNHGRRRGASRASSSVTSTTRGYPLINVDIELVSNYAGGRQGRAGHHRILSARVGGAHSAAAVAHLAGAGHRARLGVRHPLADQHPGRQRRGPYAAASSASSTRDSRASPMTGARCAPGPGVRRARSTISPPIRRWMRSAP